MKTTKMSLANIQCKLSRAEMKNIMAGKTDPISPECGEECMSAADCNTNVSCPKCVSHNSGPYQCSA